MGQLFKVLSFWLKRKRSAREHIGSWSVCVISIRFFTSATVYRKMKRAKTEEDRQNVRDKLQELENQHHGHHHHPSPATIPLLNRCCCFSLLTGAVFTGIYATAVYICAFAIELWLITEAKDELPSPPYILCLVYFIIWIMSVALLVGLALRRTQPILAWLLCLIVVFFPECGLVMFMSLYYWTLDTPFGTVELVFWIVRASMNILGTIQVFSLYSQWKEEKNVSRRLRDLSMHTSPMSNGYYTNPVIKTPLPGSLRAGYHNAAYLNSNMNLRQMQMHGNRQQVNAAMASLDRTRKNFAKHSLNRSISSVSQLYPKEETDCGKVFTKGEIANGFTVFDQWQQHQQWLEQKKKGITPEPGMAFGPMGIAGVGLDDSELGAMDNGCCPQHSMRFTNDGDYLNRAPLSRAVSTLLLNRHCPSQFAIPNFDRQRQFLVGSNSVDSQAPPMRRAHSMNDLNLRASSTSCDIKFGRTNRPHFDYIRSAGRHGHIITRGESDDFQRSYKDVAL